MSAEIGLYFDFNVTHDGIPYGCPGLDRFGTEWWKTSGKYKASTYPKFEGAENPADWYEDDPLCSMNTMKVPNGQGKQIYQYFEDYAKDQDLWIKDFIPVYGKMLRNGYKNGELVDGPNQYKDVTCTRVPGKVHSCTKA